VRAAGADDLRAILDQEGCQSWPKLTGGKDLHVTVPVAPCISHDEAREYCRKIAQRLASTAPDKYITSAALERRNGRIYLDYLRNGRGSTAIGPFSPRALKGFPIAAPVTWKQVEKGIKPDAYTLKRLPRGR
jgi:bifunctional non-homologous end joining protein LigD